MVVESFGAGGHDQILNVARTVADLDGAEGVTATQVAEAMQYRRLERNCWH
jgi:magnesium chelatase family protein